MKTHLKRRGVKLNREEKRVAEIRYEDKSIEYLRGYHERTKEGLTRLKEGEN